MNTEQNGNNISPKSASSFPFQRAVPRDANGRDDKREAELKRGDKKKREREHSPCTSDRYGKEVGAKSPIMKKKRGPKVC